MPLPKQVIDDLMNDKDFMSLPEDEQDAYIDRIASKYGTTPKSENVLQRALQSVQNVYNPQGGFSNPMIQAMSQSNPAMGGYNMMHDFKSGLIKDVMPNHPVGQFVTDLATDPETYVGGEAAKATGQGIKGAFGKIFPYTSKEARVGFTKGVENKLINRRSALTRGYGSDLAKSKGIVDLSHIMDPGSEITKFTMKEAQDLKNAIYNGVPEAVKKGVRVDPKHFQSREISGIISDAMKKADPSMATTMEKYGKHAENFKSSIAPIKGAKGTENIFGSNLLKQMVGAGGSIPEKSQVAMQEFAPRVAKQVHGARVNENIFRGLRGATVGAALTSVVPNIVKRAFLSKTTE